MGGLDRCRARDAMADALSGIDRPGSRKPIRVRRAGRAARRDRLQSRWHSTQAADSRFHGLTVVRSVQRPGPSSPGPRHPAVPDSQRFRRIRPTSEDGPKRYGAHAESYPHPVERTARRHNSMNHRPPSRCSWIAPPLGRRLSHFHRFEVDEILSRSASGVAAVRPRCRLGFVRGCAGSLRS